MQEELQKLITLNAEVIEVSHDFYGRYRDKEHLSFPQEHPFVLFLERVISNLNAIHILLSEIEKEPNIETSIGLLIRSNLNDLFSLSYISMGSYISEDEWINRICILNNDQIKKAKSFFSTSIKLGWMTEDQKKETIDRLDKEYEFIKSIAIDDLKKRTLPSPADIAKEMVTNEFFKSYAKAYDLYKYYSQYEHYGLLTYVMQRTDYAKDIKRIKTGIWYSLISIKVITVSLNNKDKGLIERLNQLDEKIIKEN